MKLSFRKAFMLSLVLHLVLMPGVGWLAGGLKPVKPLEQLLEIQLAAGGTEQRGGISAVSHALPSAPEVSQPEFSEEIAKDPPITDTELVPTLTAPNPAKPVIASKGVVSGGGSGRSEGVGSGLGSGSGSGMGVGDGAGKAEKSTILPPRVLKRVEPRYPTAARGANREGVVGLRIEILANGRPGDISISSSSGSQDLDEAAVAAVLGWRFVPARDSISGRAVASVTTMAVAFKLR